MMWSMPMFWFSHAVLFLALVLCGEGPREKFYADYSASRYYRAGF